MLVLFLSMSPSSCSYFLCFWIKTFKKFNQLHKLYKPWGLYDHSQIWYIIQLFWAKYWHLCSPLTWTSRSFFIDRLLRERIRRPEDKEIQKFGIRRYCISYVLWKTSLLRSPASYVLFAGENRTKLVENCHTIGGSQQEATKQCYTKGTQGIPLSYRLTTLWPLAWQV